MNKQNHEESNEYATKNDLRRLEENLGIRLTNTEKLLLAQINLKFEEMHDYFLTELSNSNSRVLTIVDPLLKEIETSREDREIGTAQIRRIDDDVELLKKRVTKLEHS